jgi:uncharacterized protein (DUF58 family)
MKFGKYFPVYLGTLILNAILLLVAGDKFFYRMFFFLMVLFVMSAILGYFSLHGVQITRNCRNERMHVGQLLEEKYEVYNGSPIVKFWLEIRDGSTLPHSAGSRILTFIGPFQKRSYVSYTYLSKRGEFLLSPIHIRAGDIFGMYTKERIILSDEKILVTPYEFNINESIIPLGLLPGGKVQRNKSSLASSYSSGIREYFPGDPLNHIHWKNTVRHNQLMVKEFDQDPRADVWIIIDACSRSHYEKINNIEDERSQSWIFRPGADRYQPDNSLDILASIGASYAKYYIEEGQAVGFLTIDNAHITLPAERGERQYLKILDHVSMLKGVGNSELQELVTFQSRFLPRGSLVIMITASDQVGVVSAGMELTSRGFHPLVILLDPINLGFSSEITIIKEKLDQMQIQNIFIGKIDNIKNIERIVFVKAEKLLSKWLV